MADEDPPRSLAAREAAEMALIRIADYYGGRPEFVLLGGLVPALLWVFEVNRDRVSGCSLGVTGGWSCSVIAGRPGCRRCGPGGAGSRGS